MKRIMVRYKVKADRVAENETPIRAVLEQLAHQTPVCLRYAAFKLPDGQSFVHVVSIETADGTNPLSQLAAKRRAVCGRSSPGAGL
jgi:hypothetical protein